jgi:hypothetical protein
VTTQLDIDLSKLSDRQLDGFASVRCGGESGPMQPVTIVVGILMFMHHAGGCAEPVDASESAA